MSAARDYALPLFAVLLTACPAEEPPPNEGCANCHAGIEQAHAAIQPGQCTLCHGGDGAASSKEAAHVIAPADWAEIRGSGPPRALRLHQGLRPRPTREVAQGLPPLHQPW